ncbi:N-acetylaspartate synthetase [Fundulus heteroclitus]|uniref:N-acetylaspartate synthetase n=1 Tax=Fundulus heteroclitus TaxID=8078 RepID=UPI00165C43E1|nr:N-acetylaspartate synthetase [Fundulus heteroclitus]
MHCSSPKMVCETKIVADEHDAIPGTKKEPMMWGSPAAPGAALSSAGEPKDVRRDAVFIREFERGDQAEVLRIFHEGIMERVPNTAFRGIWQQPRTQFLYAFLTVMCFYVTKSVTLTCCAPLILMGARYYYSRKVIQSYLDCALHTDMADIEAYYMKPTGKERLLLNNVQRVCVICQQAAPPRCYNINPNDW